ncbi:hypothetical protein EDB84DRAFT_1511493 [Lactarius hengduanensis]|nr:hypothetical protein EDB84DRAFT_1511493 [Lactarius hengduanensis]
MPSQRRRGWLYRRDGRRGRGVERRHWAWDHEALRGRGLHQTVMRGGQGHVTSCVPGGAGSVEAGGAGSAEPPKSCRYSSKLNPCSTSVAAQPDDSGSSFSCGESIQQLVRRRVCHERGWIFAQTAQCVVECGRAAHAGRIIAYPKFDGASGPRGQAWTRETLKLEDPK